MWGKSAKEKPGADTILDAAGRGNVGKLKRRLKSCSDPNVADEEGNTALHLVARTDLADSIRLLLEAGAKPDNRNQAGQTPLQIAFEQGRVANVNALLEGGARFDGLPAAEKGIELREAGELPASLEVLEPLFQECVQIFGEEHVASQHAMSHLARTLHALGESRRASQLFESVVRLRRRQNGQSHPFTLNSMALWAEALSEVERPPTMSPRWREVLAEFLNLVMAYPGDLWVLQGDFLRIAAEHLDALGEHDQRDFVNALLTLARDERNGEDVEESASEVKWMAEVLEYHGLLTHMAGGRGVFVQRRWSAGRPNQLSLTGKGRDTNALTSRRHRREAPRRPHRREAQSLTAVEFEIGAYQVCHERDRTEGKSVDCTVFGPPRVARGQTAMMQVFVHAPDLAEKVALLAREFDHGAARRGIFGLNLKLRDSNLITFHLEVPGLAVDEPVQALEWSGRTNYVQFAVGVPPRARLGSYIGKVIVSLQGVPRGHIRFRLDVTRKSKDEAPSATGEGARQYSSAFISYSSEDRVEVLKRVQMLALLRIDPFQDVLHLSPGDRWMRKLYLQISKCDLFLLFWSHAARESKYVREELRHALRLKEIDSSAPPEILPIVLGPPPPAAPPEELEHVHFDDYMIYLIKGLGSE